MMEVGIKYLDPLLADVDLGDQVTAARLIDILMENGVEVHRAKAAFQMDKRSYAAGTHVVRMDQPYRAFIKEMLEVQRFPEIRPATGEDILPPYDVTGWTLPRSSRIGRL